MARILGAPVTEPQGNSARRISAMPASSRLLRRHGGDHGMQGGIGFDLEQVAAPRHCPVSAMRLRSLRIRSTIIRFSARSLARGRQRGALALIIAAARRGAFHRPRRQPAVRGQIEEQFRRQAENLRARPSSTKAQCAAPLAARSCSYSAQRFAREGEAGAEAEIGLIDVAGRDVVLHALRSGAA